MYARPHTRTQMCAHVWTHNAVVQVSIPGPQGGRVHRCVLWHAQVIAVWAGCCNCCSASKLLRAMMLGPVDSGLSRLLVAAALCKTVAVARSGLMQISCRNCWKLPHPLPHPQTGSACKQDLAEVTVGGVAVGTQHIDVVTCIIKIQRKYESAHLLYIM